MKVLDLANYIILKCNEYNMEIDPLKLQKLLYYIQGYTLCLFNRPAFDTEIIHWEHGPVIPIIYQKFKKFKYNSILLSKDYKTIQPNYPINIIWEAIIKEGGILSSKDLENKTHIEKPWMETKRDEIISKESLKKFFNENNPFHLDFKSILENNKTEYNKFIDNILEEDKEIFEALS